MLDLDPKDLIPQRPPFLFVDKILSYSENKIEASLYLSGEEDYFKGHFPGRPIMPGVLQQEALFQTGALLLALLKKTGEGGLGVVAKVENARFKSFLRPKDQLTLKVELKNEMMNAYVFNGKIYKEGKAVTSVDFTCMSVSEDQ